MCLGIFVSLVFLLVIWYLQSSATLDVKLWDIETVTASDFTVEYLIPKAAWDHFEQNEAPNLEHK